MKRKWEARPVVDRRDLDNASQSELQFSYFFTQIRKSSPIQLLKSEGNFHVHIPFVHSDPV